MCSFVGGELNSLKLDLFVVGFSGGVYNLANTAKLLFLRSTFTLQTGIKMLMRNPSLMFFCAFTTWPDERWSF